MEVGQALAGGGMFHTSCLPAHAVSPSHSLHRVSWGLLEQTCRKQEHTVTTGKGAALGGIPDTPTCLPSKVTMTYHIRGTLGKMCHLP